MRIVISNSSTDPIYEQIVRQIQAEIVSGNLAEGTPLPSIRSLARDLGISVITTKRAYEELQRGGFVDSVGGKGSFVAPQNREFLREKARRLVEGKLAEAVRSARTYGIDAEELHAMLRLLWEEEA